MFNKNKLGLTIISFLSYYLTGSMIIVTGIVIHSIAQYFNLSIAHMSKTFTFLNAGILFAIFLNSWITDIISFKKQITFGLICIITSISGLMFFKNITMFCCSMFTLGMVGGITMSIGTFLITFLYDGKERTKKLLITDSFFSMSGMIFPIITSFLLKRNFMWYWAYTIIAIIYIIIFIISLNVKFPNLYHDININHTINQIKYKKNILILCTSALCYILGQLGFISWIPEYLTQNMHINIEAAGKLISNFWMSYMLGMWCFSYILQFIDIQIALSILSGVATIAMYIFIHNHYIKLFNTIIIILGFFSSAIYTIIITITSLQTQKPSQKLINLTLISGTIGTLLTFIVTGPVVHHMGIHGALIISNSLYGIVFILSCLLKYNNHQKHLT